MLSSTSASSEIRCRIVLACRALPARRPSVPRSSLSSQASTPRPRTPPMGRRETVAVVLCTPPLGLANATIRGTPRLRRKIARARSTGFCGTTGCCCEGRSQPTSERGAGCAGTIGGAAYSGRNPGEACRRCRNCQQAWTWPEIRTAAVWARPAARTPGQVGTAAPVDTAAPTDRRAPAAGKPRAARMSRAHRRARAAS